MTPAQIAHIMSLVTDYAAAVRGQLNFEQVEAAYAKYKAVEAALRDAPRAEPTNAATTELLHASVIQRIWKKCKEEGMDIEAFAWRIQREAERAARPSAPTAVEPDERADALRWREFRTGKALTVKCKKAIVMFGPNPEPDYPEALDAAIDAARASKGTPK